MTDSAGACPTWCSGHEDDPDGQHYVEVGRVGLTDLAGTLGVRNDCAHPVRVALSSWADEAHPLGAQALIELEIPGATAGYIRSCDWLTAAEARSIAHALLTAADLAEHPGADALVPEQLHTGGKLPGAGTSASQPAS